MFKVASLVVELAIDAAKLTTGFGKATKRAKRWEKQMVASGRRAGAVMNFSAKAIGSVSASLGVLYTVQARAIDQEAKQSRKIGATIAGMQELKVAANLAGVEYGTLATASQRAGRRIAEAADGKGEARDALKELGLDAKALKDLKAEDAIGAILTQLDKFSEDDQLRIGFKLFDSEGVALINAGAKELEQAAIAAERMGPAITEIDAGQIEAANDAMYLLGEATTQASRRFAVNLAPTVKAVADQLFEAVVQSDQLEETLIKTTNSAIKGFAQLAISAGGVLKYLSQNGAIAEYGVVGYLLFGKKGLVVGAALGAAKEQLDDIIGSQDTKLEGLIAKTKARIAELEASVEASGEGAPSLLDRFLGSDSEKLAVARADLADYESRLESVTAATAELTDETGAVAAVAEGTGAVLIEIGTAINQALTEPSEQAVTNLRKVQDTDLSALIAQLEAAKASTDAASGSIFGSLSEADRDIAESYIGQQQALAERANVVVLDTYRTYTDKILAEERRKQGAWADFAKAGSVKRGQIIYGEISGGLAALGQYSKKAFAISQTASAANALAATWQAAAQAMTTQPFIPNGLAAWSKALSLGMSAVAAIKSIKVGSSSTTTSTSTGGSIGGAPTAPAPDNGPPAELNPAGAGQQGIIPLPIVFHTPGATDAERADELARAMALASELDLANIDEDGSIQYSGSGEFQRAAVV